MDEHRERRGLLTETGHLLLAPLVPQLTAYLLVRSAQGPPGDDHPRDQLLVLTRNSWASTFPNKGGSDHAGRWLQRT